MSRLAGLLTMLVMCAWAQAGQPNVILFIVDDLGWQDISVPLWREATPFNERYRTPHVERLASEGMRFSNAYAAAPVCTPSRVSIMTGLTPARLRITYWTLHKDTDTSRAREDIAAPAWNVNGLQPGRATLPGLLREAGYRTIHVGKAHFGAVGTDGADPLTLGFDVNIAGHGPGAPGSYYGTDHFTVSGRQGKTPGEPPNVWDVPGLEAYHGEDVYLTDVLAMEAAAAIEDAVESGAPFYMNFAPYAVHTPIMANRALLGSYAGWDEREAAYATMIESYDNALGTIYAALEDTGVVDETVIIFTSDNGGLSAHARGPAPDGEARHTHNAPLRSGKGSAYEGGVRVPLIIRWPGVTAPGAICDAPVVGTDLFPTVLAMAGVEHVESAVDGVDLTGLLRGERLRRGAIGWNQPHQWGASGPGIWPFTSVRVGDLKLIYFHAGRRFELFDLEADIGEANDLAAARPHVVMALAGVMSDWLEETGGQVSIDIERGEPVAPPREAAMAALQSAPVTARPVSSTEDRAAAAGWGRGTWMDQHEAIKAAAGELRPRVVLIGDSITQSWGGAGRRVGETGGAARERWLEPVGPVLNAGISGDRTQHVQWRLANGLLGASEPAHIVLMIGTNNLPHDEPAEIAEGIAAILDMLDAQRPDARVLLVAPPPRGRDGEAAMRLAGEVLASLLAAMAAERGIGFLDSADVFVGDEGGADGALMAGDWVHLTPAGYEVLGRALAGRLE